MENLSHSLAGLAAGELLQRSLSPEPTVEAQSVRRRLLLVACAVAGNLPDLDLVLTKLLPAPLGYLLHHRGHTHTLLFLLPQALALIALILALWPSARRLLRSSSQARLGLAGATAIGLLLHLLMDYFNSYGLHPFYPLDSHWFYGDTVFIVEPVFWVSFGVPLAVMVQRRWLRITWLALLAGGIGLAGAIGFLHPASLIGLALGAGVLGAVQQRAGFAGRQALVAGWIAAAVFVAWQGWASNSGRQQLTAHLHRLEPTNQLLDAAMTPSPANPVCWSFVSVERNDGAGVFTIRRGILSLAPTLIPAGSCPALGDPSPGAAANGAILMTLEDSQPLASLQALAANCHFRDWMRFARMPRLTNGVASDARFPDGASNFSTFDPAAFAGLPCLKGVPQWEPPREDLLEQGGT